MRGLIDRPRLDAARLGDSLRLVAPALPRALVDAEALEFLFAVADALPPIHCAGFECRLGPGSGQVDLQQGFSVRGGAPPRAAQFLAAGPGGDAGWSAVTRVMEACLAGGPLAESVREIWLEPDVVAEKVLELSDLAPSVFAVLAATDPDESLSAAIAIVQELLTGSAASESERTLRRCAQVCRGPARVSHVGVMLGRELHALRVHLSEVPLHALDEHIKRLGWPGDRDELSELAATLLDLGDDVVVCLDVLNGQVLRVGLECFFSQKQGLDPRWPPLLRSLVESGLASGAKAEALLSWPGVVTPLDAGAGWPEVLIAEMVGQPVELLGVIERRLSHVKITCTPGMAPSAKAYFGFGHVRWDMTDAPEPTRRPPALAPALSPEAAVDGAVRRLLGARNQGGWWRDFFDRARPRGVDRRVTGYASDEWVSAYVATVLASLRTGEAYAAARHTLERLLARRRGERDGWGYHALLPADADTTAWVLRLARTLGVDQSGRLAQGGRFIEGLTDATGAVHTYPEHAAGQLAEFLLMEGSFAGWCGPHTCVTAAVAALDSSGAAAGHLLEAQRPDGSWGGHWWDDDEYTTARAIEALARRPGAERSVDRAVRWCVGRVGEDGAVSSEAHAGPSAFATALALQGIRQGARPADRAAQAAVARAERWLCRQQLADGGWLPSARLRVPAPAARDPFELPDRTLTYVDDEGLFTAATVLAALSGAGVAFR